MWPGCRCAPACAARPGSARSKRSRPHQSRLPAPEPVARPGQEGQALQGGEEAGPQVEQEALTGPGPGVVLAEGEDRAHEREAEDDPGYPGKRPEVGGDDDLVHDNAEHPDLGRLHRGQDRHEQDTRRDGEPVRPSKGPEATNELPRRHSRCRRDEPALVILGAKKPHRPLRCPCGDDAGAESRSISHGAPPVVE